MYSLYRAWFGAEESYPRLDRLTPPDIVVRVGNQGEHQFVAHKEVLATHSGYLKALLATTPSSGVASSSTTGSITSISVTSVDGEAFAPLLNYMYSGRLELSSENIYSILLATHLLHMPGALEECRRALMRLRTPTLPLSTTSTQSASILRPVPNRLSPFCWPQPALYPGSIGLPHLNHLQLAPLSVLSQPLLHDPNVPYSLRRPPSSSFCPPQSRRSRSSSPNPAAHSSETVDEPEDAGRAAKSGSPSPSDGSEHVSVTDTEQPGRSRPRSRSKSRGDVILDVACCDGPIKFHRVLNENYAAPSGATPAKPRACFEEDTSSENDENGKPESESDRTNSNYTCKYCRHTFKSQYCYKKHARRHLFSTDVERLEDRKKEDKFSDLNVQYYPCKICGSKFPSYYFVHKHRKLCHSNVDDSASGGSVSEEPQQRNEPDDKCKTSQSY